MSVENELRPEKVLFVVYRAEWWGCFDSLCREECEKRNTTVYVLPTIRFDRDAQTMHVNFGKKHDAAQGLEQMLPQGAQMADDGIFAREQRFDRIYIHNPYDNSYPVDTVKNSYYSSNLKQYAAKLVYVPHLLFIGGIGEEYADCTAYEHVDAIYLSDRRAKYSLPVQYDGKAEMVPSGIPAYLDRLAAQRKMAQGKLEQGKNEQLKAMRCKALLFCVSFSNLHYGTEKMLNKMRDVFEYFREHREIQLIFRPDEDIKARFLWLQEPLRRRYEELVDYFQRKHIGIYDESLDLYRAAVEADGILSMGHVMDHLFSVQGKYVLHLDMEQRPIPSQEARCIPSLWYITVVEEEDRAEIWFAPDQTKLICRMALQGKAVTGMEANPGRKKASGRSNGSASVEIIAKVPDDVCEWTNYAEIIKEGNDLYLTPCSSKGIWKYGLDTGCFHEEYLPGDMDVAFVAAISYGAYLYLIPNRYPGIVKYHKETEKVEVLDGWVEELERYVPPECRKESYFLFGVRQEGNMLYLVSAKCDVWMELDMEHDTWRLKPMNLPGRRFLDMVKKGEWVWLIPYRGDELMLWNRDTGVGQVVYKTPVKEGKDSPYQRMVDLGDSIAVFPAAWENMLLIPLETWEEGSLEGTGQILEITSGAPCREEDYLTEYQRQVKIGYRFAKRLKNGNILAYEYYDGAFLVLDTKLRVLEKFPCRLPLEAVREEIDDIWNSIQCKWEFNGYLNEGYTLPAMLDFFQRHGDERRKEIRAACEKWLL